MPKLGGPAKYFAPPSREASGAKGRRSYPLTNGVNRRLVMSEHKKARSSGEFFMKTIMSDRLARRWVALAGGLLLGNSLWASPDDVPTISDIRLEDRAVAVVVQVPVGLKKVTLECRTRLGAGAWVPRALARLDGSGGELVFRLPR